MQVVLGSEQIVLMGPVDDPASEMWAKCFHFVFFFFSFSMAKSRGLARAGRLLG